MQKVYIDEVNLNALRNLLAQIDEEESKENYEDIDTDNVLELTSDLIHIVRNIIK